MEGESGAGSGAPPAPPPRPPLAYEHLAFFEETRCIQPEHELAVKQHLYSRTFGIAHIRGYASRAPIFQMMQSLAIKRTIWRYLDVAKLVELTVEIVTPATSEFNSTYTANNMLAIAAPNMAFFEFKSLLPVLLLVLLSNSSINT